MQILTLSLERLCGQCVGEWVSASSSMQTFRFQIGNESYMWVSFIAVAKNVTSFSCWRITLVAWIEPPMLSFPSYQTSSQRTRKVLNLCEALLHCVQIGNWLCERIDVISLVKNVVSCWRIQSLHQMGLQCYGSNLPVVALRRWHTFGGGDVPQAQWEFFLLLLPPFLPPINIIAWLEVRTRRTCSTKISTIRKTMFNRLELFGLSNLQYHTRPQFFLQVIQTGPILFETTQKTQSGGFGQFQQAKPEWRSTTTATSPSSSTTPTSATWAYAKHILRWSLPSEKADRFFRGFIEGLGASWQIWKPKRAQGCRPAACSEP